MITGVDKYIHEDSEIKLISAIIYDNMLYVNNRYNISLDLFTNSACKDIVKFFEVNYERKITIDELKNLDFVSDDFCEYVEDFGRSYANQFTEILKFLTSLRSRREMYQALSDILPQNLNKENLDVVATDLMTKINDIIRKANINKTNIIDNQRFVDLLQEATTTKVEQLPIGYSDIDNQYQIGRNNLVIVGANTGVGKTWLALNIYAMVNRKNNAIFFTTEMSDKQIVQRIAQIYTSTDIQKQITHEDFEKIATNLHQSNHNIVNIERLTLADIRRHLVDIRDRCGTVDYVFVDYLTRMELPKAHKDYRLNVSLAVKEIKSMCKEFDCAIFLLAQLSRDNLKRVEKRPTVSDLAESANIEREADSIILLYSEEYVRLDAKQPVPESIKNKMEFSVVKNRHGKKMFDVLHFDNGKITMCDEASKIDYFNEISSKLRGK